MNAAPATPAVPATVDRENPWPGLTTFSEGQKAFFFGREEEVRELFRRVDRKALTILFGQSGLGKSSLLQAGLFPRLRESRMCPVYVRLDHAADATSLTEQIKGAVFRASQGAGTWTKTGSSETGETLWEFFHHRDDHLRAADGTLVTPVLIFDQFEELFTLGSAAEPTRLRAAAFIAELADLAENRPPALLEARMEKEASAIDAFDFSRADYRILITLREDYLPHLEGLKAAMPSLMQNRMRLTRMKAAQALDAIVKPGGGLVSPEVAAAIATFVAGRPDLAEAEIEPSLLSLVCRELNSQRIGRGEAVIGASLLAGTRDTILQTFYERSVADQSAAVRNFIEDELLTESGHRENVALDRAQKRLANAGADPASLDVLVNRRLLRIEERLDVRRIELTHDVLCGVVRASREVRREREGKEAAERELAATRAKEASVQKSLWRARLIAAICLILAVGAAGSALFGYFSLRRARQAEKQAWGAEVSARQSADRAEAIQELSQQARTSAETLVSYLLEDFYQELEPIGRLEVVAELAKRAADYYHDLPVPLRNPTTVRNQALADARYATILLRQGKADDAKPILDESLHLFDRLRDNGDDSDDLAIGYATALQAQGSFFYIRSNAAGAVEPDAHAVELLRPRATPKADPLVWKTLADSYDRLGFMQLRSNQYQNAANSLESARSIYDHLAKATPPMRTALSSYASSSSWLFEALTFLGRQGEALAAVNDSVAASNQALKVNPMDRGALRSFALGTADLGLNDIDTLQDEAGVNLMAQSSSTWNRLLELDPSNDSARHNLAVDLGQGTWGLAKLGHIQESLRRWDEALAVIDKGKMTSDDANLALFGLRSATYLASQTGNIQLARQYMARAAPYRKVLLENKAPESDIRLSEDGMRVAAEADIAASEGDEAAAARMTEAALEQQRPRIEKTSFGTNDKQQTVGILADAAAAHELKLGHFDKARDLAREAVDCERAQGPATNADFRNLYADVTIEAHALALAGKKEEALALIEPAIKFDRKLAALGYEPAQRYELSYALLVEAIAQPAEGAEKRQANFAEIDRLVSVMPAEIKAMRITRDFEQYLAMAKSGN